MLLGILIYWDSRVCRLLDKLECQFSLSCRFKFIDEDVAWSFTGVYGPLDAVSRDEFWSELSVVKGLWGNPWCIGGDFNVIRFPNERKRVGKISTSMRRFSEVIEELELKEPPVQGGWFTWGSGINGSRRARLDRFLVFDDWDCLGGGFVQKILPGPISNHCPIVLEGGGGRMGGPSPFRFENMWLKLEGFKDLLKVWWQSIEARGSSSFILAEKLKGLK